MISADFDLIDASTGRLLTILSAFHSALDGSLARFVNHSDPSSQFARASLRASISTFSEHAQTQINSAVPEVVNGVIDHHADWRFEKRLAPADLDDAEAVLTEQFSRAMLSVIHRDGVNARHIAQKFSHRYHHFRHVLGHSHIASKTRAEHLPEISYVSASFDGAGRMWTSSELLNNQIRHGLLIAFVDLAVEAATLSGLTKVIGVDDKDQTEVDIEIGEGAAGDSGIYQARRKWFRPHARRHVEIALG